LSLNPSGLGAAISPNHSAKRYTNTTLEKHTTKSHLHGYFTFIHHLNNPLIYVIKVKLYELLLSLIFNPAFSKNFYFTVLINTNGFCYFFSPFTACTLVFVALSNLYSKDNLVISYLIDYNMSKINLSRANCVNSVETILQNLGLNFTLSSCSLLSNYDKPVLENIL
jgi:hypothetical protein